MVSVACVIITSAFQWYTRNQFVRSCNYLPQRYAARRDDNLVEEHILSLPLSLFFYTFFFKKIIIVIINF